MKRSGISQIVSNGLFLMPRLLEKSKKNNEKFQKTFRKTLDLAVGSVIVRSSDKLKSIQGGRKNDESRI